MKAKLDARLKDLEKEADRCRHNWVGEIVRAISATLRTEDLNTMVAIFERLADKTNTLEEVLAHLTEMEASAVERFNAAAEAEAFRSKGRPLTTVETSSITGRGHKRRRAAPNPSRAT